jgi:hypothetical protein
MAQELAVNTPLVRRAADVLDDVSQVLSVGGPRNHLMCPLTEHSLGASAVAREVVDAASRRVPQATEATTQLGQAAMAIAEQLRITAAAFEALESAAIVPPR